MCLYIDTNMFVWGHSPALYVYDVYKNTFFQTPLRTPFTNQTPYAAAKHRAATTR